MKIITCACALLSSILFAGCGMKVGMPTAEASSDSSPAGETVSNIDTTPTVENQLMHSYSHEPMADFIMTNCGSRR